MITELDCLGDMCPIPVMKLRQCRELINGGDSVKLITDHSCVLESITNFCRLNRLSLEVEEPINGVWELYISQP